MNVDILGFFIDHWHPSLRNPKFVKYFIQGGRNYPNNNYSLFTLSVIVSIYLYDNQRCIYQTQSKLGTSKRQGEVFTSFYKNQLLRPQPLGDGGIGKQPKTTSGPVISKASIKLQTKKNFILYLIGQMVKGGGWHNVSLFYLF